MVVIEGLDGAIIGVGTTANGGEAIVYDARKAQRIVEDSDFFTGDLYDYLSYIGVDGLGAYAPIFVYLDDDLRDEVQQNRRRSPKTVH